jgi:site-specific DNA recombinase
LRAQLKRLERRVEAASNERRRLVDLYQSGLLELAEVQSRAKEIDHRRDALEQQRGVLIEHRATLAQQNRLRRRIAGFAHRVHGALHDLGFEQRQKLVRLMVEEVRVAGYHVDIRLRIPLDHSPEDIPSARSSPPSNSERPLSINERLRSFDGHA